MSTRKLAWSPAHDPGDPVPHVPLLRLNGAKKEIQVWLLGDAQPRLMHWAPQVNSIPCLRGDGYCPYCEDPRFATREPNKEAFVPGLLLVSQQRQWVPVVLVLTHAGHKALGPTPHRGMMLKVKRVPHGNQTRMAPERYDDRTEPPIPAFDTDEHLEAATWKWDKADKPPFMPAPVPFAEEPKFEPEAAKPMRRTLTPEKVAKIVAELRQRGMHKQADKCEQELAELLAQPADVPAPAAKPRPAPSANGSHRPIPPSHPIAERPPASPPPAPTPTRTEAVAAEARRNPAIRLKAAPNPGVQEADDALAAVQSRFQMPKPQTTARLRVAAATVEAAFPDVVGGGEGGAS